MGAKTPKQTPAPKGTGAGATQGGQPPTFSSEGAAAQVPRKLQEVQRLADLKPGTYWYRRLEEPRGWIVVVSAFDNNIKVRISAMSDKGLIQVLNINYNRVRDLIDLLQKIDERIPQELKKKYQASERGGEW